MPFRFALLVFFASTLTSVTAQQKGAYEEAVEKLQAKEYDQALDLARQAVSEDENNPAYLYLYGSLLHQQRRYVDAVPILTRAVALDPENLTARMMLARSYVFTYNQLKLPNFVDLTLEQLNYIIKKEPRFPAVTSSSGPGVYQYGRTLQSPGRIEDRTRNLSRQCPSQARIGRDASETKSRNGKAAEQLLIAAKQAPQMPAYLLSLGKAYKADGQTDKAFDAVRRCVDLDPQFASATTCLPNFIATEINRRKLSGTSSCSNS